MHEEEQVLLALNVLPSEIFHHVQFEDLLCETRCDSLVFSDLCAKWTIYGFFLRL